MKKCLPLLLAAGMLSVRVLGDQPGGVVVPKDPVCGFITNGHYLEAGSVTQGLVVKMTVAGEPRINEPARLRFTVLQEPGDIAVENLQLEHEKFMHVIGVRDDLRDFFHIHPVKTGPGTWETTNTFQHGGIYKIWAQVAFIGGAYEFGQLPLTVSGETGGGPAANSDKPDCEVRSGYQITFKHTEPLASGRSSSLQFLIRDAAGREVNMENFLGASMHMVIVKDDLSVCLHAHPTDPGFPDPVIAFTQIFAQPGKYKLFAQFRPQGAGLPADEAILADFEILVAYGGPPATGSSEKSLLSSPGSLHSHQ